MDKNKIGFAEALCLLLTVVISHLILTMPKTILETQSSGSLLNVIYITLLAFFVIFVGQRLYHHFTGKDILDIANFLGGKILQFLLGIAFIVYLLFVASLLVRNTSESFKTMYLQNTPIPYLMFALLVGASYVNKLGTKTVLRTNLIIVPGIVALLVLIFILSGKKFVPQRAFPIFGYGIKNILVEGAMNLFAFSGLTYLFFLMPLLRDQKQFFKVAYSAAAISGVFIFLTIVALLLLFPISIATGSNIPIYLQTREISIGDFIQRADAFFVIIWLVTILSYLSIIITFITSIFKKITNIENKIAVDNCFLAILFGASLAYTNLVQVKQFQSIVYKNTFIIFVIGVNFAILLLANIKYFIKNKKGNKKVDTLSLD